MNRRPCETDMTSANGLKSHGTRSVRRTTRVVEAMKTPARFLVAAPASGAQIRAAIAMGPPRVNHSAFMLVRSPYVFTRLAKWAVPWARVEADESAAGKSQIKNRRNGAVTAPRARPILRISVRSRSMARRAATKAAMSMIMNGA